MKCEKCGNEANYHYHVSVNGKSSEAHLCTECAQKAGLLQPVSAGTRPGFGGFFDEPFGWMDDFWGPSRSFFGRSLFPGFGFGHSPLALMPVLPWFEPRTEDGTQQEEGTTEGEKAKTEVDPELNTRRELNALKNQLQEAVKAEDFEKAITLRDKIRELEGK